MTQVQNLTRTHSEDMTLAPGVDGWTHCALIRGTLMQQIKYTCVGGGDDDDGQARRLEKNVDS